jgi:hypothetical protein
MGKLPAVSASATAPGRASRLRWPALATVALLAVQAATLGWEGRHWWCTCGRWFPWTSDAWGPHNSQHLLDPYSLTHVLHGFILCGILALAAPRVRREWQFVLAIVVECAWEVFENSAFVIDRYRAATAAQGYQGDTIANSLGDVLSCAFGFWLAGRLGWRKSLALALAVEVVLVLWIRDSLLLNVVMLIAPVPAIRAWQTGG